MANLSNINNKFLVTTGGNVLIGQTATIGSSLLQVNGIIGVGSSNQTTLNQTSTHFFMDMTSSTSYFRNTSTAGGGFIFRNSNIGDFEFDNEFAGNIKFNTSNVERMRIDSSGNVGIGTTNPSDGNFQVKKAGVNTGITNVLMNASFSEASGGLTGLSIGYRTDETTAVLAARTATGNIAFYSYDAGWSESMRIKNNGNVGIGATSPTAKVEINQTNNDIYQLALHNTHLSTTAKTRIGNWVDLLKISSNYMQSGGTKTQDNTSKASWVQTMGDDLFDISRSPAGSTTLSSLMRINSSGQVGIGTTSPASVLHIKDNSANPTQLSIQSNDYSRAEEINFLNPSTSAISGQIKYYTNPTVEYMSFSTSNNSAAAERMRITNTGKVGIGLTSPSWQLEVSDTGTVRNAITSTTNGTAGVFFRVFNSGTQVGNGTIRTDNAGNMDFWTGTTGESIKMSITDGGNVGINAAASFRFNGAADNTHAVGYDSTIDGSFLRGQLGMRFLTGTGGGSERMRITSGGEVGIGTTSPGDAKLYVNGGTTLGGSNNTSAGATRIFGDIKRPQANNFVRRNYNLTAGSSSSLYSIARQWHDHANWGLGNINVIMWGIYYGQGQYNKADFSCRYGYSGGGADVQTNFNPNGMVVPSWTSATQVSGNIHYRDLQIQIPAYYQISFEIISPGCVQTYNINNTANNTVYLYPH